MCKTLVTPLEELCRKNEWECFCVTVLLNFKPCTYRVCENEKLIETVSCIPQFWSDNELNLFRNNIIL